MTGGVAFGDIAAGNSNAGFGTAEHAKTGWTAGAGFEFALTGGVSAKVEYLHVNLGDVRLRPRLRRGRVG